MREVEEETIGDQVADQLVEQVGKPGEEGINQGVIKGGNPGLLLASRRDHTFPQAG